MRYENVKRPYYLKDLRKLVSVPFYLYDFTFKIFGKVLQFQIHIMNGVIVAAAQHAVKKGRSKNAESTKGAHLQEFLSGDAVFRSFFIGGYFCFCPNEQSPQIVGNNPKAANQFR